MKVHFKKGGSNMKQTLEDFIEEWNATHPYFKFALNGAPTIRLYVEMRCSRARYQKFLTAENWSKLSDVIDAKTHGNMYLMDCGIDYFEHGCVHAVINSINHNYDERLIIGVLRWLGEQFFPQD